MFFAHLDGGKCPVGVGSASSVLSQGDACLLVVDVVVDVSKVPDCQVSSQL